MHLWHQFKNPTVPRSQVMFTVLGAHIIQVHTIQVSVHLAFRFRFSIYIFTSATSNQQRCGYHGYSSHETDVDGFLLNCTGLPLQVETDAKWVPSAAQCKAKRSWSSISM